MWFDQSFPFSVILAVVAVLVVPLTGNPSQLLSLPSGSRPSGSFYEFLSCLLVFFAPLWYLGVVVLVGMHRLFHLGS